jgi:chromosome segregation ATPase
MAQVLSLKELRTSSVLKAEIKKLEEEKQQLLDQMDRQKKMEQKLRDDIISHKKDFEHLEKQFEHFAGLEADYETLQQELQMERLEKLISNDKQDNKSDTQLKKLKEDLGQVQAELKELKQLDPQRLKRQVTDLKKKNLDQAKDNKNLNTALVAERKESRELTAAKEQLEQELDSMRKETHQFWESTDSLWALFETGLVLKGETADDDNLNRIRCLNRQTGASVVSSALGDDDKAVWLGDLEIPEIVSVEAGKRLKNIAAEAEEDDEDL